MAEDYIWIITDDDLADGARDGGVRRNPFDDPQRTPLPTRRGFPVEAKKLEQGMTAFLTVMGRVLDHVQQRSEELAGMNLDEVELSIEINAEGQVSLLGTGGKAGSKGAMTLRFKKLES